MSAPEGRERAMAFFPFGLFENEIISKISLFLTQAIESWLQFLFSPPEKIMRNGSTPIY